MSKYLPRVSVITLGSITIIRVYGIQVPINTRRIYYKDIEDLKQIIQLILSADDAEEDMDTRKAYNMLVDRRLRGFKDMSEVKKQSYTIHVESPFILTPAEAKRRFGIGFQVTAVERGEDATRIVVTDKDSAIDAIIAAGYKSLARAYHPDLGGNAEIMMQINQARKELKDLIAELRK